MLSEEFDNKIRDAADHHHPTYDENAWEGMKKLLDQHLPEEKDDRRRIIFFLLLFLLLGGATWYFVDRSSGKTGKGTAPIAASNTHENRKPGNTGVAENKQGPGQPADAAQEKDDASQIIPGAESKDNNVNKEIARPAVAVPDPATGTGITGSSTQKTKKQTRSTKPLNAAGTDKVAVTNKRVNNDQPVAPGPDQVKPVAVKNDSRNQDANLVAVQIQKDKITEEPAAGDKKSKDDTKADDPASTKVPAGKPVNKEVVKKEKKDRPASKRKSSFSVSLSAGPDVSFTRNDGLGRMKFPVGAGIGYTYREKFTLRTGFYTARKIYTSSPENYNAPAGFYTWYPNLQRIDADCKVYEIPLNLSYHFSHTARQSFFATAGVSSYLMKRETYDYYYKYIPTGPTLHRAYSFYNENDHFFSVLNLGAGYQRHIGKRVSITAEPYFKIPLKGVGYGKVKLNSAGVLFSLSVKPFHRVEKK